MARIDPFISPTRSVSNRIMESLFRDSSPDFDEVNYEVNNQVGTQLSHSIDTAILRARCYFIYKFCEL